MIEFFRDTISGWLYFVYIGIDLLFIFALIGYIAEKKQMLRRSLEEDIQEEVNVNNSVEETAQPAINNMVNAGPPIISTPVKANSKNI